MCQGFSHFSDFGKIFVLAKLASSSIRANIHVCIYVSPDSPPKGPPIPLTQLSSASPQSTSPLPPGPKGRKRLSDEVSKQ